MPPTSTRSRQTQQIAAFSPVKTPTTHLVAGFLLAACESADHTPNPSLVPAEAFDAKMWNHLTNGVPDVIRLDAGTYLTRGSRAWWLAPGDSLIGAGMNRTVIRRMDPDARFVVNGWTIAGTSRVRVTDLTLDANATLAGKEAACGIGGLHWKDSVIERVRVIRLGSFSLPSESFGIILEDSTN